MLKPLPEQLLKKLLLSINKILDTSPVRKNRLIYLYAIKIWCGPLITANVARG